MNIKIKLLFVISSTWQGTCLSASLSSSKYDLTQPIQNSIVTLFQNVKEDFMRKFVKKNIECHNHRMNHRLENGMILDQLDGTVLGSLVRKIDRDFDANRTRITIDQLYTEVYKTIIRNGTKVFVSSTMLTYFNVSINVTTESLKNTYSMNISYLSAVARINDNDLNAWFGDELTLALGLNISALTDTLYLTTWLKSVLPKVVLENVEKTNKFRTALTSTFCRDPRADILSTIPHFLTFEHLYYYLIREARFSFFSLTNIFIHGLSNYASFKSNDQDGDFVHTLEVKPIRGRMTLDYRPSNAKTTNTLELVFQTDGISITIDQQQNRINVQARNYRVNRTDSNSELDSDQSAIVMHHLESALASSLMPFMKIWWKDDQRSRIHVTEDQIRQLFGQIVDKKTSHDYQVTFHNVTVTLVSGLLYPKQIHCQFPENLNITHHVHAKPIGKIRVKNVDETIDINFNVNFTSIRFSVVSAKDLGKNDTCEFLIQPNSDIKVETVRPQKAGESSNDDLKVKDGIDRKIISAVKEQAVDIVKSTTCSAFNFCKQSVKVVDDFVRSFVDQVLEKCSLRGDT